MGVVPCASGPCACTRATVAGGVHGNTSRRGIKVGIANAASQPLAHPTCENLEARAMRRADCAPNDCLRRCASAPWHGCQTTLTRTPSMSTTMTTPRASRLRMKHRRLSCDSAPGGTSSACGAERHAKGMGLNRHLGGSPLGASRRSVGGRCEKISLVTILPFD